jgi:hypothetical protein
MEAKILSLQQILQEGYRGEITNARKACQEISQHLFCSVFFQSGFCGCIHSVFGNLPYELLHLWYLSLIKYLLLQSFGSRMLTRSRMSGFSNELMLKMPAKSHQVNLRILIQKVIIHCASCSSLIVEMTEQQELPKDSLQE